MPMVLVCGLCSRSEVEIRPIELTFRGYMVNKPHSSRYMRRVKVGITDLCERCLQKMCPDAVRSFKEVDAFIEMPVKRHMKSKFGHFRPEAAETRKTPE